MPYIIDKNNRRQELKDGAIANSPAELNFQIFAYIKDCLLSILQPSTYTIKRYITKFLGNKPNYQKYNDMTGCLLRCQKEIKRKLGLEAKVLTTILDSYDVEINKYEEKKIIENGDI